MTTSFDLTPEQVELYTAQAEAEFAQRYMTAKEVEENYKVSMSRQTQLIKAGRLIVVKSAQRVLYPRDFAQWWFGQYVAAQTARVSTKIAKSQKKAGRPKKVKGEYTYMLWGQEYKDTRPPAEVEREWKVKVASYYPHVMQDVENHMVLREAMTYPDQYPDYRDHVRPLFAEIGKLFRKLAAGQE